MTRRLLWLTLLAAVGCSKSIDGPTPTLTALQNERAPALKPGVVCNAQGDPTLGWPVDLVGTNFSPLPTGTLTSNKGLAMPTVALGGPEAYTLGADRVFFKSTSLMVATFPTDKTSPAKSLAPGSYDVTVTNPNGHKVVLSQGLMVVPPPTITGVSVTTPVSPTTDGVVEIDGTNFRPTQPPTVTISGLGLQTVTLTNIQVPSTTVVNATVPANTAEGTYDVTVTNPEGCAFTLPGALVISYHSLGTLTLDPHFGWQLKNQPVTIYNAFTSPQQPFSGGAPTVFIVAPLKTAPTTLVRIPLRRVAYVSPNTITGVIPDCSGTSATPTTDATCPNGIQPGGPYALEVKDPSGAAGTISAGAGFSVLTDPPPTVTSISPNSITTAGVPSSQTPGFLTITGQNFDTASNGQHSKAQIGFQVTGGVEYCDLPNHAGGTISDTELDVEVPSSIAASSCVEYLNDGSTNASPTAGFSIKEGLYLIRVQHLGDVGAGDYSGLTVTSTSYNPVAGPTISTKLAEPLDDFPLVAATDDLGNSFLYALGGHDQAGATANVELAAVSKFGDIGGTCTGGVCTFQLLDRAASPNQHQGMLPVGSSSSSPIPTRGASAVVRQATEPCGASTCTTSYLFLIGGQDDGGNNLDTVYRAQVLRNADAPVIADTASATAGTLTAGTYYYRVSAIRPTGATEPNPGGETLPSDESPGQLSAAGGLSIQWTCIPNVATYKVYRTVNPNDPAGTEALLDTVGANCTGAAPGTQSYTDNGGKTPSGDSPLPQGALGMWVQMPSLTVARSHAKAVQLGDTLVIAGGSCNSAGTAPCSATGDLKSVEQLALTAGLADPSGSWTTATDLSSSRAYLDALLVATHETLPQVPAGSAYLLAVGGRQGTTDLSSTTIVDVTPLSGTNNETIGTWTAVNSFTPGTIGNSGGWAELQSGVFFMEGTQGASSLVADSTNKPLCGTSGCTISSTADFKLSLNAGFPSYTLFTPRWLVGESLFRAYIYTAGGASSSADTTLTDTLERYVY